MPQIQAAGSPRPSQRPAPFQTATNVSCTASATASPSAQRRRSRAVTQTHVAVVQLPERATVAVGDRGEQLLVGPHAPRPPTSVRQSPPAGLTPARRTRPGGVAVLGRLATRGIVASPTMCSLLPYD